MEIDHTPECNGVSSLNWLSFANEGGFIGAVIVKACCPAQALKVCTFLHINPGGEVKVAKYDDVPDELNTQLNPYKNKLLNKETAISLANTIDNFQSSN